MNFLKFVSVWLFTVSFLFLLVSGRLGKNIERWIKAGFEYGSVVFVLFSVVDSVLLIFLYPLYVALQTITGDARREIEVISMVSREILGLSLLVRFEFFLKEMFHG